MPTYDSSLSELLRICESEPQFADVQTACVVRDLKGRLRLVLQIDASTLPIVEALGAPLQARLRGWFHGPILATCQPAARGTLAKQLLRQSTDWPRSWPAQWMDQLGTPKPLRPSCWRALQRKHSKQSWLEGTPIPPWPMESTNPGIVAFHSFKGGVGRTTTLAVLAWQWAKAGKTVVCVDLDLEAPGLGTFLGSRESPAPVLECLLEHAASGRLPQDSMVQDTQAGDVSLHVVTAGALDSTFIEKLARLDYLGTTSTGDSPVGTALKDMLNRIRREKHPDLILLDCRAGFHDLGALGLTDLAHVDVLVGRNTTQGRVGTSLTLRTLAQRRRPEDQRMLLVQTFVPLKADLREHSQAQYRQFMHDACMEGVYTEEPFPNIDDTDQVHHPWPIPDLSELAEASTLGEVDRETLKSKWFEDIRIRLDTLLQPEEGE